jgi:hypothetical protein
MCANLHASPRSLPVGVPFDGPDLFVAYGAIKRAKAIQAKTVPATQLSDFLYLPHRQVST